MTGCSPSGDRNILAEEQAEYMLRVAASCAQILGRPRGGLISLSATGHAGVFSGR
jgi:hypothetical protein